MSLPAKTKKQTTRKRKNTDMISVSSVIQNEDETIDHTYPASWFNIDTDSVFGDQRSVELQSVTKFNGNAAL